MKLLLDTHTFMWWDSVPDRISPETLSLLKKPENQVIVSLVSVWEIQIKTHLGKLELQALMTKLFCDSKRKMG